MLEDGALATLPPPGASWPPHDMRIDSMLSYFLCNDEFLARCRRTPAGIAKQVELWNYVARSTSDHQYDDLATKVISLIAIPTSEASCERTLSRQKRTFTHLRCRSSPELIRARIFFEEIEYSHVPEE
jgi:hypothetical protein